MVGGAKFGPQGEFVITVVVPFRSSIDAALTLRDGFGLMLNFDIARKSYDRR